MWYNSRMNSVNHNKLLQKAALLLAGAVIGAFGVSAYLSTSADSLFSRGFWQGMRSSLGKNQPMASACVPQTKENDIFFLTCGGIY